MKLETGGVIKMTKDEALKMAIEAFKTCETYNAYEIILVEKALNACKEALGNLEKDYSFSRNLSDKDNTFADKIEVANCNLKQPAQEPVAWQWLKSGHMRKKIPKTATPEHWRPLYTKEQL